MARYRKGANILCPWGRVIRDENPDNIKHQTHILDFIYIKTKYAERKIHQNIFYLQIRTPL